MRKCLKKIGLPVGPAMRAFSKNNGQIWMFIVIHPSGSKLAQIIRKMNKKLIEECGELLAKKGLTLAFAESATAGRMAMEFSLPKDSGKFLKGGLVCYDACLKESLLGVSEKLIEAYTPESAEVTCAIAQGLIQLIPADIYIGVTGLVTAGGSETEDKPVGTMFTCALFGENKIFEDRSVFNGSPEEIILKSIARVGLLLKRYLTSLG